MNRLVLALATALILNAAPAPARAAELPAPFVIAAAEGIDFDDESLTRKSSTREGHAEYDAAEYKAALAELPKDQQIAVKSIMKQLDKATKVQFEALIAKHRVSYKDATGKTLVDNLWMLVDKKLAHGIKNKELLKELIRDVVRPSTIAQAAHNTCTATSIQSALARQAPGEYARIIAGLASGDGVVTARNGKLKLASKDYIAFEDRTVTSNLLQPAIMEQEARLNDAHYDNKTDYSITKSGEKYQGAMDSDVSKIQTALLVGKYKTLYASESPKKQVVEILKNASAKEPVLVGFWTKGGGGHEVQVVGYEKKKKSYKIRNPWGELLFLPSAEVEKNADGVNYRIK